MAMFFEPAVAEKKDLGLLGKSRFWLHRQQQELPVTLKLPPPIDYHHAVIGGQSRAFALPVTFTPFASVRPCSARCVFCSETLVHKRARILSAQLRPGPGYFAGLAGALDALGGVPMGISLSGLEATDDAPWLLRVLETIAVHEANGGTLEEKVLYSNGNGLARGTSGGRLLPALARFGLTRIEMSRHHWRQAVNQDIMRFREGEIIRDQAVFEETLGDALEWVPVRLVCILQASGVSSLGDVRNYLAWARDLGVNTVIFRELSRLGDLYRPNRTWRTIEKQRVVLEEVLDHVWPSGSPPAEGFEPEAMTAGYYYWNLGFRYQGKMKVIFETSDYTEMKARHQKGVVHKLVFHANGNLCGDWDPEQEVLLRTGDVRNVAGPGELPRQGIFPMEEEPWMV